MPGKRVSCIRHIQERPGIATAFFVDAVCVLMRGQNFGFSIRMNLRLRASPDEEPLAAWPRVVFIDDEPKIGVRPPICASAFQQELEDREAINPQMRMQITKAYRHVLEHGYNGLVALVYANCEWSDDELVAFSNVFKQVSCPHVHTLNLSNNVFSQKGLDALGEAVAVGSLAGLKTLALSGCQQIQKLPAAFSELKGLEVLKLDGCESLSDIGAVKSMTGLKELLLDGSSAVDPR